MADFLNKLKLQLSALPKIYWIYFAAVIVAELVAFALRPNEPGLYSNPVQFAPLAIALGFLFTREARKNFRRHIYTYGISQFIFLALDYNLGDANGTGHAGLYQIATLALPLFIFWLVLFARWNVARIREFDSRRALLLSGIAWGLFAFAFPPLPLGPAALLLLVPWFIVLDRYNRSTAIFATFWSGMIYNTVNYYWIYNVMNVDSAPSGLICLGVFLLIAFFSAYSVFAAFVYTLAKNIKFGGRAWLLTLYPIFYAGLEMTRTRGDFAFPWSHLGYVFGNTLESLQALSVIGIFGYTALIIASNMIVASAIEKRKKLPLAAPALIYAALLVHGNVVLSKPEAQPFYGADAPETPLMAMVQPSIQQGEKWSKARFDSITAKTFGMVNDSVQKGTNLIILAETAVPDHIRR